MKLFELQHNIVKSSSNITQLHQNNIKQHPNSLGTGMDAVVFQSKNPSAQGIVKKIIYNSTVTFEQDHTIQYLLFGNNNNNPLVPRVYKIKQIEKTDNHDFVIEMEKLYPLTQLDIKDSLLVESLLLSIFDPVEKHTEATFKSHFEFGELIAKTFSGPKDMIWLGCTRHLNSNALAVKQFLHHRNGRFNDINSDNIMLRYTSTGVQLVIADPLTNGIAKVNANNQ